jgi:hypothetical protein
LSYFEDVVEGAGGEFTPTQALLASVLENALQDYARPGDSADVRRFRSNACRWLFGNPLAGDGLDFEHVCEALHLEPDAVRKLVLAGRIQVFPLAGRVAPPGPRPALEEGTPGDLSATPSSETESPAEPSREIPDRVYGT